MEITSTGDVMILGGDGGHTDMFTVLDVEALSTHYMVSSLPDSPCQLGLVGVKDNTQVTLTWPEAIKQKQADLLTNITLHRHQSIQLEAHVDLTGLKVSASQSMAVFSGSQYTSSSEGWYPNILQIVAYNAGVSVCVVTNEETNRRANKRET